MSDNKNPPAASANAATSARSSVGCLHLDDKGIVLELDAAAEQMLNRARHHLVGQHLATYLADGDRLLFFGFLRQAFLSQGNVVTELRIKTPDGMLRDVRLESSAAENGGKPCISLAVAARAARQGARSPS